MAVRICGILWDDTPLRFRPRATCVSRGLDLCGSGDPGGVRGEGGRGRMFSRRRRRARTREQVILGKGKKGQSGDEMIICGNAECRILRCILSWLDPGVHLVLHYIPPPRSPAYRSAGPESEAADFLHGMGTNQGSHSTSTSLLSLLSLPRNSCFSKNHRASSTLV